jgi:hypothetical protein
MFAQVRQNPEFAEPRTEPGVRFGSGSGSASVQNRTPTTTYMLEEWCRSELVSKLRDLSFGRARAISTTVPSSISNLTAKISETKERCKDVPIDEITGEGGWHFHLTIKVRHRISRAKWFK